MGTSKVRKGVYCITCLVNNKKYIGSSVSIKDRYYHHNTALKANKHINKKLQKDYNEFGTDLFTVNIIEEIEDVTKLTERERYWIEFLETNKEDKGYNCSLPKTDTQRGKHSKETIELQRKNKLEYIENNKEKFYSDLSKIDRTKIKSPFRKAIIATNIETNKEIEFESIAQASRELKLKFEKIQYCIRGKKMKQGKLVNVTKVGSYKFRIKNDSSL